MVTQNQSKVPDGTLLEGKFRVTREIGRGGMAAVYEAENVDIGKRVAVKILAAELITSRIVRERFLREARAAAAVRSPYICDVYDSGMFEERPFLVMELLEGESLYDLLTRARQLDFDSTLRIATHSARGLQKAHESNIVHRDLKPENIFLTKDEEGKLLAKLVDFGLAKFYEPTGNDQATVRLTREGALFGTPAYMSPEQAKGKGEVDHRADLWALGCIVYECLTGQTVWSVDQGVAMILAQIASAPLPRPNKLRPDLPPSFEQWFLKALDRDPDKRFQTARELADALTKALVPAAPTARGISLSSDHEGMVVDELMGSNDRAPKVDAAGSFHDALPQTVRAPDPAGAAGADKAPEASSGRAISILMFVALVCLGGYAAWLYVLHPPGESAASTSSSGKASAAVGAGKTPKSGGKSGENADADAYTKLLFEAQDLLTNGSAKDALERFKAAFAAGSQPPARSLLSQATIVVEEGSGSCRVDALARPRPFGISEPSSRPTLIKTERGILYGWVDTHVDPKKRQGHVVLLDGAMRRVSDAVPVTPEAVSVRSLQLVPMNGGAALVYWDDAGDAGVYVRRLEADGKIAGPGRRISDSKRGELHPSLTPTDAGYWALWEEDGARGHVNVMARQLDDKLEIKGKITRLADVVGAPRSGNTASSPDAVIAHGALQVVLSVDRGADKHQILLLRVPQNDPALGTGLVVDKKKKKPPVGDSSVGTLVSLSRANSKNTTPRIACLEKACTVVWDDDNAGAYAAYIERDKAEPLWHREFSPKGIRPTLVTTDKKTLVAWYEDSRLKLAELGRDGLGKASVLARVNGFQPEPDVARGEKPGQWLVAFRDYESAHFEAFGLRTECQ
ncbi:MAG: serine/threonine protein kinase [Myxococcales bacterium]|nr:MAG: serine/threonine protein kinase [Myxococcales bacterium]